MNITTPAEADAPESRHAAVLEAAVGVFARYGFRKTSMDEVARAAGVSRQGLYLQFANKEELFRRALEHTFDGQLAAATAALARQDVHLEQRLVAACDAWAGKFIGSLGADATDLMCASTTLAGAAVARYEAAFAALLAEAIEASGVMSAYAAAGLGAADLAGVIHAAARGFKHASASREDYSNSMKAAARMLCAPRGRGDHDR